MAIFEYGKSEEQEVANMMTAIVTSLRPFRERNVPALLCVFALSRCCKAMLQGVGYPLRDQLAAAVAAHVKNEHPDGSGGLVIPVIPGAVN